MAEFYFTSAANIKQLLEVLLKELKDMKGITGGKGVRDNKMKDERNHSR
jgi:hypothetical protein